VINKYKEDYKRKLIIECTFYVKNDNCYMYLNDETDYYDSNFMDGFILYNNNYVIFYGLNAACGKKIVYTELLKKERIPGLKNYNKEWYYNLHNGMEAKNKGTMPSPPPPPGELYSCTYLITKELNFIITEEFGR
jgi:hypothetical protein